MEHEIFTKALIITLFMVVVRSSEKEMLIIGKFGTPGFYLFFVSFLGCPWKVKAKAKIREAEMVKLVTNQAGSNDNDFHSDSCFQ